MQGATFDEFKAMIAESREIEYAFGGHEYFYQRSWAGDAFEVYVLCDGKQVFHERNTSMDVITSKALSLRSYNGKAAEEAQEGIAVTFEA